MCFTQNTNEIVLRADVRFISNEILVYFQSEIRNELSFGSRNENSMTDA